MGRKKLTIEEALRTILDQVDYMADNCRINEMVGAVLPIQVIELCREALNANAEEIKEPKKKTVLCFEGEEHELKEQPKREGEE